MKALILSVLIYALLCGIARQSLAQGPTVDIVYLNNGSVIRGSIVEVVPNATLKIRTADGSIFVYNMAEVERIVRADSAAPRQLRGSNPYTIHKRIAAWGLVSTVALTFVGSLAMRDDYFATTILPVVGPWVTIARIEGDRNSQYLPGGKPLLIASGVAQGGFLVYLVTSWTKESAYNRRIALYPMPNGPGLAFVYRF